MSSSSTQPGTLSISAFNKHMGYKGRYAYELHKTGRLVMTDDGKHVRVAESIRRIEETRDPSRAAVAQRHATTRGQAAGPPSTGTGAGTEQDFGDSGFYAENASNPDPSGSSSYNFQDGKAKREHYAALREEAAYHKEIGQLMDAQEALGAFADAGAKVAAVLDAVPATVGPMLAGLPQDEVMRVLTEQMDIARTEMAAAVQQLVTEIETRSQGAPTQ